MMQINARGAGYAMPPNSNSTVKDHRGLMLPTQPESNGPTTCTSAITRGGVKEQWFHSAGCRQFFMLHRDTFANKAIRSEGDVR